MPRKQRIPKQRRAGTGPPLTLAELEIRSRWGDVIAGVPALTVPERQRWHAHREAQTSWVPMHALGLLWDSGDPRHDDALWTAVDFAAAIDRDRDEIAQVVGDHPDQADRLHAWVREVENVARDRDQDRRADALYEKLLGLGYSGQERGDDDADGDD